MKKVLKSLLFTFPICVLSSSTLDLNDGQNLNKNSNDENIVLVQNNLDDNTVIAVEAKNYNDIDYTDMSKSEHPDTNSKDNTNTNDIGMSKSEVPSILAQDNTTNGVAAEANEPAIDDENANINAPILDRGNSISSDSCNADSDDEYSSDDDFYVGFWGVFNCMKRSMKPYDAKYCLIYLNDGGSYYMDTNSDKSVEEKLRKMIKRALPKTGVTQAFTRGVGKFDDMFFIYDARSDDGIVTGSIGVVRNGKAFYRVDRQYDIRYGL